MPLPNQDLSSQFSLDIDSKVILPSKQLIATLELKLSSIYQAIRETIVELNNSITAMGQEFYDRPLETVASWYDQAVTKSVDMSNAINNEVIPELNGFYQSSLQTVQEINQEWSNYINDSALKVSEYLLAIYENPKEMSEKSYEYLAETASQVTAMASEVYAQFVQAVTAIYQSSKTAINLFLDAPQASAESMYLQVASWFLELYSSLISSVLETLGGNAMPGLV